MRYNSAPARGLTCTPGMGLAFIGRLTREKGVDLLIAAWREAKIWRGRPLVIAGDGPDRSIVEAARRYNVQYLGSVDQAGVAALLDEAALVVIPSRNYEGFPRLVAESFERGRPVAATNLGSLKELITSEVGWTASPEPKAFARMLEAAVEDPTREEKGIRAWQVFETILHPRVAMDSLLEVYAAVTRPRYADARTLRTDDAFLC